MSLLISHTNIGIVSYQLIIKTILKYSAEFQCIQLYFGHCLTFESIPILGSFLSTI